MDRETRRANFKKLQQPPATTKLRTTRSSKAALATTTLSDYFSSQESAVNDVVAEDSEIRPATTDKDDLFAEPKSKKTRESQDTKPAKPKKAPKLKSNAPPRRGRGTGRGRSKQPSISDFLRNEQMFAEVTAQHCMADNFSPDDIEMALALSKSEAEKHGILRLQDTMDEEDDVVNLLDNKANQSTESIRKKLQKYGFRTAAKEDYNVLSIAGATGKRGKRCKWANKFTALTLRKPDEQLKKVENKVVALMAQQVRTKLPSTEELQMVPFELISTRLQQLKATTRITHEPSEGALTNLSAYYVEEMIEVSKTPGDHLLKSWAAIQGRDLSPKRRSEKSFLRQQQLEQVYAELEAYFGEDQELAMSTNAEKAELDELEKLVADNMVEEESTLRNSSPVKEPPDKRSRMTEDVTEYKEENKNLRTSTLSQLDFYEEKENLQTSTSPISLPQLEINEEKDNANKPFPIRQTQMEINEQKENLQPSTSSMLTVPTQSTRCTSPDLFADSDDDDGLDMEIPTTLSQMQNFSLKVYKDTTSREINCYEIYSSDEVKTLTGDSVEKKETKSVSPAPFIESFVDLTEEQESPVLPDNASSGNSLLEQQIMAAIESDGEIDELNCTLSEYIDKQIEDCEISDKLYAKYAHKNEEQEIILESNAFNTNKSLKDNSSFHLTNTPHSSKDNSFSLPRSFSLTQTSNLEHSFKSPSIWKSNSFTDKSGSECNRSRKSNNSFSDKAASDVSIDLTQDSCDEDEAEVDGVLLSDDEINYSIWQADKTHRDQEQVLHKDSISPLSKRKTMPYFKTIDDLDAYLDASPAASIKSSNSRSPNKSALSKERAEFGILDAALSQPFTLSQMPSEKVEASQVHIDWNEASFLDSPTEVPLKRYSSSSHKFKELIDSIPNPKAKADIDDELDEFDRMVFQSAKDFTIHTVPSGMDRLLLGDINMDYLPEEEPVVPSSPAKAPVTSEQLEVNGQLYSVRACQSPKPDFIQMPEPELWQHLYNYGIKPLKRKQAVKLLEFIYNQTHPIMLPLELEREPIQSESLPLPRSKSTPLTSGKSKQRNPLSHSASNDCLTPTEVDPKLSYKFKDACGTELLRFSQAVPPALCDDFECYVLQTNVTKKTPQPLLPLHIAWHNLLCANPSLHESVLMYEPIDLQEIYLYLKQLGHRYDPKDLKCFFDRRCIIFRYELAPPTKQVQRHIRKKSKKPSSKI